MSTRDRKRELRKKIAEKRSSLSKEYKEEASKLITEKVTSLYEYMQAETVFCFVSTAEEPETRGIIQDALERGKTVAVPLVVSATRMLAKKIESLEDLTKKAYGIYEPSEDAKTLSPKVFDFGIIPCVTASLKGDRLGHGKGYYDRYLLLSDMTRCIINFDELMSDEVPTDKRDLKMDIIITENAMLRKKRGE